MFPKPKTYRSKKYLEFIRGRACLCCGRPSIAHHEPLGGGGKGIKCDDSRALPLCPECHMFRHNNGVSFWVDNDIDPKMEIIKLLTEYLHEKGI